MLLILTASDLARASLREVFAQLTCSDKGEEPPWA